MVRFAKAQANSATSIPAAIKGIHRMSPRFDTESMTCILDFEFTVGTLAEQTDSDCSTATDRIQTILNQNVQDGGDEVSIAVKQRWLFGYLDMPLDRLLGKVHQRFDGRFQKHSRIKPFRLQAGLLGALHQIAEHFEGPLTLRDDLPEKLLFLFRFSHGKEQL
jgi:hypothetical protein